MKRLAILIVAALLAAQSPAMAAPKVAAGLTCSKVGTTQVVSGKKFTCIKSGKKTVWDKGVAIKKSQTITADPVADVEVSEAFFSVNVKASSGLMIQASSTTPQVCQINLLLIVVISKAGKCTLTFTQSGNASFNAASPVTLSFNVTKMTQEISTSDDPELKFLDKKQSISWDSSSGLEVTLTSLTPKICTVLGDTLTFLAIGTCEIQGTQAGNDEYLPAAPYSFKYEIVKTELEQEISTNDDPELQFLDKTQKVYWEASSGLDVTLTSLTPRTCTVRGDTLTLLAIGTCEIQGTQAGNDEYLPAAPYSFKYEIVKAAQEIEFDRIDDVGVDAMFVDLAAYSNASDENIKPVYTTSTPTVCEIEDDRVLLLAAGECTVLASHPGTAVYAAAPEVSQTFNVLPARVGSLENPATAGVTIKSEEAEITFIEYTEEVDMAAICEENSYYEGCTEDEDSNGIPDPDAETKIVALLFEFKNIGKTTSEARLYFSVVFEEEFIEVDSSVVPRELIGKKLLPNAKAEGYVFVSVPYYFDMEAALLYFQAFDEDLNDVYIALGQL